MQRLSPAAAAAAPLLRAEAAERLRGVEVPLRTSTGFSSPTRFGAGSVLQTECRITVTCMNSAEPEHRTGLMEVGKGGCEMGSLAIISTVLNVAEFY